MMRLVIAGAILASALGAPVRASGVNRLSHGAH
jgi:hypothetical protein